MKAEKTAKEVESMVLVVEYRKLAKKYREEAKRRIESRTHDGNPTKNTVTGVINGMEDWTRCAARELDWNSKLVNIFLLHQAPKILKKYGFYSSKVKELEEAAKEKLEKAGLNLS